MGESSHDMPPRPRNLWDRLFRGSPEPPPTDPPGGLAMLFPAAPAASGTQPDRATHIEREPPVGAALGEHVRDARHVDRVELAAAVTVERGPFLVADGPDGWRCEQEKFMRSPQARSFTSGASQVFAFAGLELLNSEGVVFLNGVAMRDSVDFVTPAPADASVEWARPYAYLKLRRPVAFAPMVAGSTLIGYAAAWRNYGHWLLQCLPKLVAFVALRERVPGLRVALPPLSAGSAFQQTLELLGIAPGDVLSVPAHGATRFERGYVMANPSIWDISPLAGLGADMIAARLGAGAEGGAPRVYLHRAEGSNRRVANFAGVRALVERFGFVVYSFEHTPLAEQVRIMRSARCVIAEHGSATTNILFCRAGTRVLQLFNPVFVEPCFWSVASARGLDYGYVVGHSLERPDAPPPDHDSDYAVPLDRLEAAIGVMLDAAAAMPPRPREASPGQFSGLAEPAFATTVEIDRFGFGGRDERLLLFGPATSPPPLPALNEHELPEHLLGEHRQAPATPGVYVSSVDAAEVWSNGLVTRGGQFIAPADCFPGYLRSCLEPPEHRLSSFHLGALGRADVRTVRLTEPVLVALHPNLTYGYFLTEMLPRLYLATVLRQWGARFRLALPNRLPAMVEPYIAMLGLRDDAVRYDPDAERLQAPAVLLASMMQVNGHLHPAINLAAEAIRAACYAPGEPTRLFVWRSEDEDGNLVNRQEVAAALAQDGFVVVDPQRMPLAERLRLLARAAVIVGDAHAGLNESLFAPPGACVISLNFASHQQGAIARVRRQRMGYLPPRDGRFRHWYFSGDLPRAYEADPVRLRALVRQAVDAPPA